jgi:Amiloride-sensitive sodium channel
LLSHVQQAHQLFFSPNFRFDYTRINIYFKENQFMTIQRSELRGSTMFLANCGGLFGLCLGISIISVLEIFYFFTIRLFFKCQSIERHNTIFAKETFTEKKYEPLRLMKDLIVDYVSRTTVQGVKYVGKRNLYPIERIWWTIVIFISIIFCGSLILNLFKNYDNSPVTIHFADKETPVTQVGIPIKELTSTIKIQCLPDSLSSCHHMPSVCVTTCDEVVRSY